MLSVTETGWLLTLCMAGIILLFSVTDNISCSLFFKKCSDSKLKKLVVKCSFPCFVQIQRTRDNNPPEWVPLYIDINKHESVMKASGWEAETFTLLKIILISPVMQPQICQISGILHWKQHCKTYYKIYILIGLAWFGKFVNTNTLLFFSFIFRYTNCQSPTLTQLKATQIN